MTASKRPKNSALEVELDFEHGARPAPVVTEEITQSIEEMIRLRIIEVSENSIVTQRSTLVFLHRPLGLLAQQFSTVSIK